MSYYSSDYVDSNGKPLWDAFGKLSGELRQFAEDIKCLGSISSSDEVKNAECVIRCSDYTDDEKDAAAKYLDERKKLVDAKLNGVDYSTLIEQAIVLLKSIHALESFGLQDTDIEELDAQYGAKARALRAAVQEEAQAKLEAEFNEQQAQKQAEREKYDKECNEKLDKNFRIASALIEKAFGDVNVTRTSYRDNCSDNTEHYLYFPVWMFNDNNNRCYCVDIQHCHNNYKHKWFYSVMCSRNVLPTTSYKRYSDGVTSGKNYDIKAFSHDFNKMIPVVAKGGHFVFDDNLASVCSDDREIQPPQLLADVDISDLDDILVEESNIEEHNID